RGGVQQLLAGAKLRRLRYKSEPGPRGQILLEGFFHVARDQGSGGGGERFGDAEDVIDHRPAGHAVQDLWPRRLHARALARGQDHDVEIGHDLAYRARRGDFRRSALAGGMVSSAARTLSISRSDSTSGS